MVKRCGGLPLALLVLGGLLSRKLPTALVWQKVYEDLDWESTEDGRECLKILALSYTNLPNHYLKSCFLYMGVFPEDSEMKASKLIKLWIAEGFIQQRGRELMEDTACSYLEELAERSLIQVVRRSMYHGGISRCRIHDLLRETCLVEAKQAGFLNVVYGGSTYEDSVAHDFPISHRLALHNLTDSFNPYLPQNLRSLFVSSYGLSHNHRIRIHDDFSLHGMKWLRVLEVQIKIGFWKDILLMTRLRYLNMEGSSRMTKNIGKLRCLQTLDLRDLSGYGLEELPDLSELPDLRHLYLPFSFRMLPPAVTTLTKLQTLKNVLLDEQWIKENLARLTRLRSLSLEYKGDGSALSQALGSLTHLASLRLTLKDEVSVDMIVSLTENRHFQKLYLHAKILERRLSDSGVFPPNLAKLTLVESRLEKDPMPVLERLPNLLFILLGTNAYIGEGMVCTTGGFPRLRTLKLDGLSYLTRWIVEAGAFANLTGLEIKRVGLDMLPRIRHVPSIKLEDWRFYFRGSGRIQIYPDGTYNIETWSGGSWHAITL